MTWGNPLARLAPELVDDQLHVRMLPSVLHNVLATLTNATLFPSFLALLRDAQVSDPMLGRYWRLARSQRANFSVLENSLGQFLAHKGRLFVPTTLVPTVLHEFHDARGHFGVNRTYAMIAERY